jgi:DNA-binding beta-propeller fold protein YncE
VWLFICTLQVPHERARGLGEAARVPSLRVFDATRFAAEAVAHAIPALSLDIVGIIGEYVRQWVVQRCLYSKSFDGLHGGSLNFIAVDGQSAYVSTGRTLRMFKLDGTTTSCVALDGVTGPAGIAFDKHGAMLVGDNCRRLSVIQTFLSTERGSARSLDFRFAPSGTRDSCFELRDVSGICVQHKTGMVYVCDEDCVTILRANGDRFRFLHLRERFGESSRPWSVAVSSSHVFVTDYCRHCVRVFDNDGKQIARWEDMYDNACMMKPMGIAYDSKSATVLVCDSGNNRLLVFSADGHFLHSIVLWHVPIGVCVDDHGVAYVCGSRVDVDVDVDSSSGNGSGKSQNAVSVLVY